METEAREPTGVTRGQNAVHVMPQDWSAAERVVATLVDRMDLSREETQLLVVTADSETAAEAALALVSTVGDRPLRVVSASASPRAARILRAQPAHVITGAPADLAALLQGSSLKPAGVRAVVFAWIDAILESPESRPLETLMGELPKEGARVVLTAQPSPALETFIERYARRPRRTGDVADAEAASIAAEYVATAAAARASTLRRLLDTLDLPRAVLYARSESVRNEARAIARSLGYGENDVRLASAENNGGADALILVELPDSGEALRTMVGTAARKVYALVQPTQLASLRSMLGGGALTPVTLLDAADRARGRDAALRASLREVLTGSDVGRELLALEPLLSEFDGIEVAAAALRLLEQQRPARQAMAAAAAQTQPMQRLFVNLGEKDGIRSQEIVAAITTEAGIPGSQVGKVEVRDTHSIVEVAVPVAPLVVEKLTGSVVRGRRVQARLDTPREDRPARSGPPPRGDDRSKSFSRGDRPARNFDRGDRGDRGDRPPRSFDRGERGDRPVRTFDRAERGDRPDRGDRPRSGPPRGAAGRGERPGRPSRPLDGPPRKFDRDSTNRPSRPRPRRDDA